MRPTALSVLIFFGLSCATTRDQNWTGDTDETSTPAKKKSATSSSTAPPQSFVAAAPSGDDSDFAEEAPPPATPGAAEPRSPFDSDSSSKKALEPLPESNPPPSTGGVPIIVDNGSTPPDQAFIGEPPSKHKKKHHKKKHTEEAQIGGVVIRDVPPTETVITPEPSSQPAPVTKNDNSDFFSSPSTHPNDSHKTIPAPEERVDNTPPPPPKPPPPPDPTLQRDKKWIGISITAGVGVLLANNFRQSYTPELAYGGQVTINPKFAGNFALDLSFWRASQYGGTSFDSITGSTGEIAARVLYLQRIGAGFFIGGGLGFDMTWNAATYTIAGAGASASQFQPGGEATFALGWRISYFETRLDVRAILSGGLRMDYLPDLSVGVTF